jgi:pimeloyl-ACP methyl ester carboxylesterase
VRASRVVLVHGAAHGAWCWEKLIPLLEQKGYEVEAPDLPGLGDDATAADNVTFQAYVDRVIRSVTAREDPVLLVGHSMGGGPISEAAERMPGSVAKLFYVAAALPIDGESISANVLSCGGAPALERFVTSADGLFLEIDRKSACDIFFNLCAPEVAQRAALRLRPQAVRPLTTPLRLTRTRWGEIPKTYLICAVDQMLPPDTQRRICSRVAGLKTLQMDTDHSPFYSDPQGLSDLIDREARC